MLVRTLAFLHWHGTKLSISCLLTSVNILTSPSPFPSNGSETELRYYYLILHSTANDRNKIKGHLLQTTLRSHKCYTLSFSIPGIFVIFINLNLSQYIWTVVITSYSYHWRMCSRAKRWKQILLYLQMVSQKVHQAIFLNFRHIIYKENRTITKKKNHKAAGGKSQGNMSKCHSQLPVQSPFCCFEHPLHTPTKEKSLGNIIWQLKIMLPGVRLILYLHLQSSICHKFHGSLHSLQYF